jgi:hypothetical protein
MIMNDNEPQGAIESEKFVDTLSNIWLVEKDSYPWK